MENKKYNKLLIRISVVIFCILVLCTFLSRTIASLILPEVEAVNPIQGELPISVSSDGIIEFADKRSVVFGLPLKILKVNIKENDMVHAGDVMMEVDISEIELQLKRLQLNIRQLEDQLSQGLGQQTRSQLLMELEIAEKELDIYISQFPADGKIIAEQDSVVVNIYAQENKIIERGDSLMDIYPKNSLINAAIILPEEVGKSYQTGDSAVLSYTLEMTVNGELTSTVMQENTVIERKEYDPQNKQYRFYVPVQKAVNSEGKELSAFFEGQPVTAKIIHSSYSYSCIIPLSAVSENSRGELVVFVLRSRNDLFGEAFYVSEVIVEKISGNNTHMAILSTEVSLYDKIVLFSSSPLISGETVRISK